MVGWHTTDSEMLRSNPVPLDPQGALGRLSRMRFALLIAGAFMALQTSAVTQIAPVAAFKGFTDLTSFSKISPWPTGEVDYLSPAIDAGIDWNELVASWDVQASAGAKVSILARAVFPDHESKFYVLGVWSPDPDSPNRTSIKGQGDADGTVDIDTLALVKKARSVQIMLATQPAQDGAAPNIRFLGLSFADTSTMAPANTTPIAELAPLDVPEKCQMDYPNGGGYCSPTSVSMVLNYWAKKLNRPDLAKDVPEVVSGLMDKGFNGTGNWPFNTAYAGTLEGLKPTLQGFRRQTKSENGWTKAFPSSYPAACPCSRANQGPQTMPDTWSCSLVSVKTAIRSSTIPLTAMSGEPT